MSKNVWLSSQEKVTKILIKASNYRGSVILGVEVIHDTKEIKTGVEQVVESYMERPRKSLYIIVVDIRAVYAFFPKDRQKFYQIKVYCGTYYATSPKLVTKIYPEFPKWYSGGIR
jgi:hypothetical protein